MSRSATSVLKSGYPKDNALLKATLDKILRDPTRKKNVQVVEAFIRSNLRKRSVHMKGTGIKSEREVVITYNEDDDTATITTSSEVAYRRMKKRGWFPSVDSERRAVFHVPKRTVHLPLNRARKRAAVVAKGA